LLSAGGAALFIAHCVATEWQTVGKDKITSLVPEGRSGF